MELAYYHPHVVTDAHSKEGLGQLIEFLDTWQPSTIKNTLTNTTTHTV